jgi:peroxiredoxin
LSPVLLTYQNTRAMNKAVRRLQVILILITILLLPLSAGKITIQGKSVDYSGESITFYSYSNMISFTETILASCEVNDSGSFSCSIELEETRLIFTRLGIYNCFFFAEPGANYVINLPPRRDKTLNDEINPYFLETALHLQTKIQGNSTSPQPEHSKGVNFLIRAFDDSFYPYYYKYVSNAYVDNIDKEDIKNTIKTLEDTFDSINNQYFTSYLQFRIGLLNHHGAKISNNNVIKEYFLKSDVHYFNPAYMELFNRVFDNYFAQFTMEYPKRQLPILLNREKNYTAIQEMLKDDGKLDNDTLRELVFIKALYDGLYNERNIRSSILQMLDSVRLNSGIKYIRETASDVMLDYSGRLPGTSPPDFALYDSDSNMVKLSDFKGDYVYLNFCNSYSYYCIKEYEYLKILHQRMTGKELKIITILVDDSYSMMHDLVRNNNYPWTFLHFSAQPEVIDHYDIRSYPAYFLIGPDGEMILSPAPSPAENFENTFLRILQTP